MTRSLLSTGAVLTGLLFAAGCAPDFRDSIETRLAAADTGWSSLSDYQRGKQFLETGDTGLAIQSFTADLQRHPASVPSLNGLAIAFERLGRTDIAERFFRRALAVAPDSAITLNNMAYLHMSHGDTDTALAEVERARAAPPAATDKSRELVATVLNYNEAAIRQLVLSRHAENKPRNLVPPPVFERVSDREWVFHNAGRSEPVPRPAEAARETRLAPPAGEDTQLDIVNASGRNRMARRIGRFFTDNGFCVDRLLNAEEFGRAQSVLFYQRDAKHTAATVTKLLPVRVRLIEVRHDGGRMQLVAGQDLDAFDADIARAAGVAGKMARR